MLKRSYDVAIVGGGVMGSSIAYHLSKLALDAEKKLSIAVIEKDKKYVNASAMLSAGGLRQQFSAAENTRMSMYGAEFLKTPEILQVNDCLPCYQFHQHGYLFLAGADKVPVMKRNNQTQQACGVSWMELMGPQKLQTRFPWLNTENIELGSFGHENEGYFDPWSLLTALKTKSIAQGVEYIDGEVMQAEVTATGCGHVRIDNIGFRQGSSDNVELISPGVVVNACGPWAGKFVDMLSAAATTSTSGDTVRVTPLPVQARKRSLFLVHCSPDPSDPLSADSIPPTNTPLTVDSSGVWFRSEGTSPGTFLCGVSPPDTAEDDPSHHCEETLKCPDHSVFEEIIWPALYNRVPAFERLKVKSFWAGFYEYNTFDQNAIIGEHSDFSNLLLCNGFSGHGLQQSPAAGRGISELIFHGKYTTLDLSSFHFDRVHRNEPFFEEGVV